MRALLYILGWLIERTQRIETRCVHLFIKPEYVRQGACQGCGACCRTIGVIIPKFLCRPWGIRYFAWWHGHRFNFEYLGHEGNMLVYTCRHLTDDNRCSIYRFRPRLCREFPRPQLWGHPDLHDGCGFYFTKCNASAFAKTLAETQRSASTAAAQKDPH